MQLQPRHLTQEFEDTIALIQSHKFSVMPFQNDIHIDALGAALNERWCPAAIGINLFWEAVNQPENFEPRLRGQPLPKFNLSLSDLRECISQLRSIAACAEPSSIFSDID